MILSRMFIPRMPISTDDARGRENRWRDCLTRRNMHYKKERERAMEPCQPLLVLS